MQTYCKKLVQTFLLLFCLTKFVDISNFAYLDRKWMKTQLRICVTMCFAQCVCIHILNNTKYEKLVMLFLLWYQNIIGFVQFWCLPSNSGFGSVWPKSVCSGFGGVWTASVGFLFKLKYKSSKSTFGCSWTESAVILFSFEYDWSKSAFGGVWTAQSRFWMICN